jgi:hypothetical protein
MANVQPDRREPIEITAGTSINFQRSFRLYPAPAWVIYYEIRGAAVPIEFVSAQPANGGTEQLVFVPGTTTEGWPPGHYELAGYATNATTGEKYECYHPSEITINPDLQTAPGDQSTKTFAQLMVEKLEAVMLGRASNDILDSEINGTMIRRIPAKDLKELYFSFKHQRQGEIAKERARNKQPTGRRITTQIAVTFPNPVLGGEGFGAGNIYRGGL